MFFPLLYSNYSHCGKKNGIVVCNNVKEYIYIYEKLIFILLWNTRNTFSNPVLSSPLFLNCFYNEFVLPYCASPYPQPENKEGWPKTKLTCIAKTAGH